MTQTHTQKFCIQCGTKPRKVSKTGKTLTMCDDCQREYWRLKKTDATAQSDTRRCEQCKQLKPTSEFGRWGSGYRRTCKACNKTKITQQEKGKHLMLVHGQTLYLVEVVSQTDANNKAILLELYRQRGYQIEHVFESEAI